MRFLTRLALILPALALTACMESPRDRLAGDTPPQTVGPIDLDRYAGLWFEIFRADHSFERDCHGVTAFYERQGEDRIRVINRCWKNGLDGPLDIANGRARLPDPSDTSRLEVSFFGPFYGDYWVIDLAEDYSWALVSEPAGRYLWMLSRTPRPDPALIEERLQSLRDRGFDTDGLIFPDQWESEAAMPRTGLPEQDG
ncbi:lipocalin family protein [Maricaulis parjimensis]|uniref:lipocalin family protein n=1 Tax=Maricaulis parjimensis TaxID=144023 RepID=UPI00193A3658|nr:lipocalin family protein [Maricaulis parjimensis]